MEKNSKCLDEAMIAYLSTAFWKSANNSYKWTLRAKAEAASTTRTVYNSNKPLTA